MEHDNGTLVLLKDFYNVREIAALLHWSRGRVYTMAERKVDPLPLRRFEGRKRNYLIQRDELIDWYDRNCRAIDGCELGRRGAPRSFVSSAPVLQLALKRVNVKPEKTFNLKNVNLTAETNLEIVDTRSIMAQMAMWRGR